MIKKGTKYKWVKNGGFCPHKRSYKDIYKENNILKNMNFFARTVSMLIQISPVFVGGEGCKLCRYHSISRKGMVGCSFEKKVEK